jgi:predicted CoA-binding protein
MADDKRFNIFVMSQQQFFKLAKTFAVVGASADKSKFGNKVLVWYKDHSLPVVPVNPKQPAIEGLDCIASLDKLKDPLTTSVSLVTNPAVTESVLKQIVDLKIGNVWIQPGKYILYKVQNMRQGSGMPWNTVSM